MAYTAGSEFQVNSYTTNDQNEPSVTTLSGGGFVVTWTSDGQRAGYDVYGQIYSATGAPVGSEFIVNSYDTGDQTQSSVTALSGGGFVVTFTSSIEGDGQGVYGRVYSAAGSPVGSEFQVNSYTTNDQASSRVTGLSGGGFVVTWESYGQDGDGYGVYGQAYSAAGTAVGSEFRVNGYTTGSQASPSVTGLSGGGFVVTWKADDGDNYGIYGQLYSAAGSAVGSEFRINTYTTDSQTDPTVASLSGGGFVVSWISAGQDGDQDGVYGQLYSASGSAVGSEFRINTYTTDSQWAPKVAALSGGGFVATWASSLQDGDQQGIYGQAYSASGSPVGSEFLVNSTTTDDQRAPSVAALSGDSFVVTWASIQDGGGYGTYGKVFTAPAAPSSSGGDGGGGSSSSDPGFTASYPSGVSGSGSSATTDGTGAADWLQQGISQSALSDTDKQAADDALNSFLSTLPAGSGVTVSSLRLTSSDGTGQTITLNGADGTQAVIIDASSLPPGTVLILENFEFAVIIGPATVNGGAGRNYVIGDGGRQSIVLGPEDDTLAGGSGDDTIGSAGGNDLLYGNEGNDFMFGGIDNDSVYGNQGMDSVYGNQGNDLLYGGGDNDLMSGGAGNDSVQGDRGNDRVAGDDGDDVVTGGDGNDGVLGGTGKDLLFGNQGADTFYGGQGDDTVYGGRDNDVLFGGRDNDRLSGDEGNDVLSGDAGADTLTGGGGVDWFVYNAPTDGCDTITDFTSGLDKLVVNERAFGGLAFGTLDSRLFAVAGQETADTRFIFNAATGTLSYDADGSGLMAPTTIATVLYGRTLKAEDILVI
jgi:hypothetical protein